MESNITKKRGKHPPSILSRRKLRRLHQHTEGHSHKNPYWTVACEVHGTMRGRNMPIPLWVKVKPPETKWQRRAGCPKCAAHSSS